MPSHLGDKITFVQSVGGIHAFGLDGEASAFLVATHGADPSTRQFYAD